MNLTLGSYDTSIPMETLKVIAMSLGGGIVCSILFTLFILAIHDLWRRWKIARNRRIYMANPQIPDLEAHYRGLFNDGFDEDEEEGNLEPERLNPNEIMGYIEYSVDETTELSSETPPENRILPVGSSATILMREEEKMEPMECQENLIEEKKEEEVVEEDVQPSPLIWIEVQIFGDGPY